MTTVKDFAPAKINLTLHVTGQRADGYHLLDSLVVFADVGDQIRAEPATETGLTITGPEAHDLTAEVDNLVLRAARLVAPDQPLHLTLKKSLPVSSGIGGGSSDAAATLRAVSRLCGTAMPTPSAVLSLGADVPVCLNPRPQRMTGIGETIHAVRGLPQADILLVNPRVAVATPDVFRRLPRKENPAMPTELPHWHDLGDFAAWLGAQRNDLAAPAAALQPVINDVLAVLQATDAVFVGMSGSGATCFALLPPGTSGIAENLQARHPGWWVAQGAMVLPG